jgi:hypothetical protein
MCSMVETFSLPKKLCKILHLVLRRQRHLVEPVRVRALNRSFMISTILLAQLLASGLMWYWFWGNGALGPMAY